MVDSLSRLEQEIQASAGKFPYPPTPRIAQPVMLRLRSQTRVPRLVASKLVWMMVILIAFTAALMFVPPVRAAVLAWIQIGVVRILPPAPAPVLVPTSLSVTQPSLTATPASTSSPSSSPPAVFSLLDLAGETTLAEAQTQLSFPILVPTYPADLGLPDRVYLQEQGGPMLVLIWLDPANPNRVRLSLHTLTSRSWAIQKIKPVVIQETTVMGQPGIWVEGPYFLQLSNQDFVLVRLIEGHVLIWTQADLTYRLETDLTLEDAALIADSLTAILSGQP